MAFESMSKINIGITFINQNKNYKMRINNKKQNQAEGRIFNDR